MPVFSAKWERNPVQIVSKESRFSSDSLDAWRRIGFANFYAIMEELTTHAYPVAERLSNGWPSVVLIVSSSIRLRYADIISKFCGVIPISRTLGSSSYI